MFTHHCFQTDRLDEAIQDFCKSVGTQFRSLDAVWISVHAQLPVTANRLKRRKSAVACAAVLNVALGACGHFS